MLLGPLCASNTANLLQTYRSQNVKYASDVKKLTLENTHLKDKFDEKDKECTFVKGCLTTQVENEEKGRVRAHEKAMAKQLVKYAKAICMSG